MLDRLYHRPELHSPALGRARRVGWLELFYDLVFVATIIRLGTLLAGDVSAYGVMRFVAAFTLIWFTWIGYTFFTNRFVLDDLGHRALVFLQMWAIGGVALSLDALSAGDVAPFALCYGAARAVTVLCYLRAFMQVPVARAMTRRFSLGFGTGAVLWLVSAALPRPYVFLVWAAALIVDFATPLSPQSRALAARFPPDGHHISERFGLLTLIVLGESFVKVLSSVGAAQLSLSTLLLGGLTLAITCSLWWLYFDDIAGSRIKPGALMPYGWLYGHLPLTLGITATGVALYKVVSLAPMAVAPNKVRYFLCGSLALVLLSVALLDAVSTRRQSELRDGVRVSTRLGSAALVMVLAPAGGLMPAWVFLLLVAGGGLAQILFDIAMAPQLDPEAQHAEHPSMFDATAAAEAPVAGAGDDEEGGADAEGDLPERPDYGATREAFMASGRVLRRGAPSELKRDLYFHFMEASWGQMFVVIVLSYLGSNLLFATLYLLEPGSVSAVRPDSFLDAFAFSVQTMTTIGYGTMTPVSTYAHLLVIAEAFLGIVGVALVTGLIFAKASRPRASVLFSRFAVVHDHDEARVLSFRVANARGNEVVEASLSVALLVDEVSRQGQRLRRLHDLKLVRQSNPVFMMSWQVFHVIDEDSPLHGLDAGGLLRRNAMLIVTLTGHDGTYATTVHSRYAYGVEDILFGHRFRDVISRLPDGRMLLDLSHFHDTQAVE